MGWVRVSDDFYDNDKMIAAGSIGRDLYWHGMAFCNRNLTDGLVPIGRALTLVDFTDAAVMLGNFGGVDGQECAPIALERLLEAGLWHEDGHDCPDCIQPGPRHYIVHDYLKYQPSKAEIEAKAEANRKRVEAWREARRGSNAVSNGVGNALHTQHVQPTPTPTPTPSNSSLVTSSGGVTEGNARASEPPSKCLKHIKDNNPPNCGACADARRIHEEWAVEQQENQLAQRRRIRQERESCPICDENGMRETACGLTRCDHMDGA